MEIITLNNENCKEYTDAEFLAKVEELERKKEEENDLSWMFDDEGLAMLKELEEQDKKEQDEKENTIKETKEKIENLNKEIESEKAELNKWENKTYKRTKATTLVGDEIGGNNYTYYSLNMKRRAKRIKSCTLNIEEYTNDVKNLERKLINLQK